MQACISPLHRAGRLSSNWSAYSSRHLRVEPSAAADTVQSRCWRSALKSHGRLGEAAPLCAYRAVNVGNRNIVRKTQQAGQSVGFDLLRPFQPKQQPGASHLKAQGRRQANVCRSSLHQVAPLYELAAGGETINPWSLIALAVGTAALAYLSGVVMGKQLDDEAEEMAKTLSEQGENAAPEPPTEPVRKRNRPIRREP